MSIINKIKLAIAFIFCFAFAKSQIIQCPSPYVYMDGGAFISYYNPALPLSATNPSPTNIPTFGSGLTLMPNINNTLPSPTFYTTSGGFYYYWNGVAWINTGHSTGNTAAVNLGGCGGKIYNIVGGTGQIYVYNGTGPGTLLTTITGFSGGGPYDLVTDCNCNFYVLKTTTTGGQSLSMYSPSGVQTCSYSLSNFPNSTAGGGFAIIGNKIYVKNNLSNGFFIGTLSGSTVTFTQVTGFTNSPGDFASCPNCPTLPATAATSGTIGCNTTTANVIANTTITPVSYTWTGPSIVSGVNASIAVVSSPGVYTVTISSPGCPPTQTVLTVTVTGTPSLAILASNTGPYCPGATINLSVTAGTSYTWTGPNGFTSNLQNPTIANAQTINGGVYTVSVSAGAGCNGTHSTNVIVNPPPIVLPTNTGPYCPGATINLSVGAATSYTWTGPNAFTSNLQSPTIANAQAINGGVYTVAVTNTNGCIGTATTNVIVNPLPIVLPTNTGPYCAGATIQLNVAAATSYTWTGPNAFTSNLQNPTIANGQAINAGVYTVSVTNVSGCIGTGTTNVIVNPLPIILPTNTGPYCAGATIQLNVAAGTSYTWTGPSAFISNLQNPTIANAQTTNGGVYTVTVTNANGCKGTGTTNVVVNPLPVPLPSSNSPLCVGKTLNLGVGASASYTWSGPGGFTSNLQFPSITNVTSANAGIYTITVTNPFGCKNSATINVVINPLPIVLPANTGPYCVGNTINLSVGAATSYTWTGPNAFTSNAQNPTIANAQLVHGGVYTVSLTTAFGCIASGTTNVVVNPLPVVLPTNTGPYCAGATINLSVGAAASYTWTGPSAFTSNAQNPTIANAQVVNGGIYTVTLTTAFGCKASGTTNVIVNPLPVVTPTNTGPYCVGNTINLSVNAASSYTWTGPNAFTSNLQNPTIANAQVINAGVYTVAVTSAFGCTNFSTTTVVVNPLPIVLPTNTGPYCAGATINLSVGASSSYTWTGPSAFTSNLQNPTLANAQVVNGGVYTVTVSTAFGCKATGTTMVVVNPVPVPLPSSNSPLCVGKTLNLGVGAAASYTWAGPGGFTSNAQFPSIANVTAANAGIYTISVTSPLGCLGTATINVVINPLPIVLPTNTGPYCIGNTISLSVGASASYTWTGPNAFASNAQNPTIANAQLVHGGVYTVSLTTAFGCIASGTTNVVVNPLPVVLPTNTGPYCAGATINLSVGAAASYTWSGPSAFSSNLQNPTIANAQAVNAGVYTVSVTSALGCVGSGTTTVVVNPLPIVLPSNTGPYCAGATINLSVGASSSYTWTGPNGFTSNLQNPTIANGQAVNAGVYTVSVTSAAGCLNTSTTNVIINPLPVVLPSNNGPYCVGNSINLSVGAATSYTWTGPNAFTSNLQNPVIANAQAVHGGVYTVSLTTAFGCVASGTTTVVVNPLPVVFPTNTGPYCVGNTINLAVGAAASYTWTGPNAFTSSVQNPSIANAQTVHGGVYTVSLTTPSGCLASGTVLVVVNPLPVVLPGSNSPVCTGNPINLSVNAATSYTWTGPNAFTSNVQNPSVASAVIASGGNYSVSVTNGFGCISSSVITVVINPTPTIAINPNPAVICLGNSINLTASGATAYTWTPATALNTTSGANVTSNPLVTTNYTVLGSSLNCTNTGVVTVSVLGLPSVTITPSSPTICMNNFNGSPNTVTLNATGAASYTWGPIIGLTTNTLNGSSVIGTSNGAPVATGTVIGANGSCTNIATFSVNAIPNPVIAVTSGSMCAGTSVTLSATGANTFTWSPSATLNTANGSPVIASPAVTTVYSVIGSSVGCNSQTQTGTASVVPNPTVTIAPLSPSICIGTSIGLTASGATAYTWTPAVSLNTSTGANVTANPLVTTTYSVIGSQATCTHVAAITVTVVNLPVVSISASSPTLCMNNFNGSPNTVVFTGAGATTYTWGPISGVTTNTLNGSTITGTSTGAPIVSVTVIGSAATCTNTATFTVSVIPNPIIAVTSGSMCFGTSVNLTSSGANTYTWSPSATLNTANGNAVTASPAVTSVYSVIGSSVGCNSQTQTGTASVVPNPTVSINPNPAVICLGNSINLTAIGATAYTWTPATALTTTIGANTTANPLVTTTYSVIGSQATCTHVAAITVSVLGLPSVTVTPSSPTICMNNFNGSPNTVTLTATGAASYTWGPITGLTTNTLNGSSIIGTSNGSSVISGTILGMNGTCTNVATFTMSAIPNPVIAVTSGSMCFGTSVNLTSSGANTYTWSPSATLNTANGNAVTASPAITTVYSVIGSSVGCNSQTQTGTANVVPNPTVTLAPLSPSICIGTSINLTANGATDYTWTPAATLNTNIGANVTANPTVTTTYSVIGSQATCTHVAAITVTVVNLPVVSISASSPTLCMNNFNGSPNTVTLNAAGAASYTWGPITGLTTNTLNGSSIIGTSNGLPVGTGTVIGANGSCTNTATFTVSAIPNPIIAVTSGSMCFGTSVNLTSSGANTYTWSPSATLNTANGNAVTASPAVTSVYSVIGSSVGCNSQTQTGTANVVPNPTVTLAPLTPTICIGGSINLTANGATDYTWTPAATLNTNIGANVTANPTVTTTYTVLGSQATCTHVSSITVAVISLPVVNITANSSTLCMNNFNGSPNTVTFTASGANTFTWGPISGLTTNTLNGASIIGTSNGTPIASVTVIGTAGTCTNTATYTVAAIPNPIIAVTSGSMCFGTSVNLTSSGANTYTWSPSASLNTANGNAVTASPAVTTVYSVIGSSVGCNSQTQTGTASVVPNPTVTLAPLSPTICIGSSINLTASGATDYTWTPAASLNTNIGSNVTASPNTTTTYSVIGSQATCTHVAAITVTVVPLPIISIAAASPTLCMNSYNGSPNTVAFTAAGASTYTWGPITGLTANTLNGSSIIGTSTGASQIGSVTVMGTALSSCTNVASFSVAIIPNPIIAVTSGSMCFGTSVNLTSSGANTYTWSPSATLNTANGNAVTASPTVTTVYSVIGSSVGCQSQTQNGTASVVPNPTPSIAPLTPTICIGTSINLTASGATDYTWTPANTLNTNIGANVTANPTITTTYTVIGSQATCTNTAVRTVTVVNLPVINITTASPTLCMNNFNGSPNTVLITAAGATSYTWTGFVGLNPSSLNGSSIVGTSILQSPIGTGSVIGMLATCTNVATFTVAAVPNPIITVSSATMCFGTSAVLNANGADAYVWSPAGTLSSNTGSTVIASPNVNTIYSVIGSSLGCNSNTETGSVGVVANPTISITSAVIATLCAGESIGLSGSGANTYTWLPSNLVDSPNSPNVIATPPATTNYTLIGSANSCSAMAIKQVTVIPLPTLQAIAQSTSICSGSKTTINANGAVNYTWSPVTGLSSGTLNFVVANPVASTIYTLTGTNGICINAVTVQINVINSPVMNLSTNLQKICEGNSTSIFASGANTYTWSPESSLQHITTGVVKATPSVSTNYTVMAINYSGTVGCSMTQEILIDVVPQVTASISNSVLICEGESTRLNSGGRNTYVWSPPTGLNNSKIASPYASPTISTIYTVNVSDGGFCAANATVLVQVSPKPYVNAGPDQILNLDEPMYLNASGTGTMKWIFGENILCHDCPNSQITPQNSGDYIIETINKLGCKAQDVVHIEVTKEYSIYIPNVFTPNFDGNNDEFIVYGVGISEVEMYIFDRWGEKLYTSTEQLKGWDGVYKGELCKNDVYVYIIKYKSLDNKKHTRTGHVSLLK